MKCKICNNETKKIFSSNIMGKYNADYFYCSSCGFLGISNADDWLNDAYKNAINEEDTGILSRNEIIKKRLSITLPIIFKNEDKFLDYSGGYGLLVRLMRDSGFDFYWSDLYCENIVARGFEGSNSDRYAAITCIEVFEHLNHPLETIRQIFGQTDTLIITTEELPNPIPTPEDWWYYGLSHGQHISFYRNSTFEMIANILDLKYYKINSLRILTRRDIREQIIKNDHKIKIDKLCYKIVRRMLSISWIDYEYRKVMHYREPKTFNDMLLIMERKDYLGSGVCSTEENDRSGYRTEQV